MPQHPAPHRRGRRPDIGAGVDGTVWGVNNDGNIYRYGGDQPG
ncbi:hypothetical protein [Streptomyces luteolus]|uniref:Uncharacterized protein n=1 Tax=Streptomyces luteolus TaxID=3043615 RepID=A0ABT6T1C4_9ACTN|nr:hypothetical protein [Streptomyces sp. B-S-A12]MDI3420894.1 hypothetical protein [Streptomyces sp. B-S-A12]